MNLFINNICVPIKVINFSDGALNYCLPETLTITSRDSVTIQVPHTEEINSVLTKLVLLQSSLPRYVDTNEQVKFSLTVNYLPYARADRQFGINQSNGLASWVDALVKCLNIKSISLIDPHSIEALNLFNLSNIEVSCLEQKNIVPNLLDITAKYDLIVAPDKGSIEKAKKVATRLNLGLCTATKVRDINTGHLSLGNVELPKGMDTLEGKRLLIVDDLIDGGMTFINLANKLRDMGAAKVSLYVTHGIFAKGLQPLEGVLDNIYVYQIIGKYICREDLINFNNSTKEFN